MCTALSRLAAGLCRACWPQGPNEDLSDGVFRRVGIPDGIGSCFFGGFVFI